MKAFNSSQQNYSAVKRELLAGMFALERWRPFFVVPKILLGNGQQSVDLLERFVQQNGVGLVGFFPGV